MTEHRPESAQQLPDHVEVLRCVTLPAIPTVYGLEHPEDGVTAWVFVQPGGLAIIVPRDEDGEEDGTWVVHTSLDQVVSFWAPLDHADLVLVAS
jgi:hypothetical protein